MQSRPTRAELLTQASGRPVPASQATTIEQSRAVAQVQGALIVAQQRPRNTLAAAERMREACGNQRLAERSFFSYRRGGSTITGASVHLARELARCWGNIEYGITELARDDAKGESEMLAYAWDLETNNRNTNSFIVPHRRDTSSGAKELSDQRDLYENNANNAARRLRECIFGVLPRSFRDEAEEICRETLESGGGEPIEVRRRKLSEAFAAIGVTPARIARRVGRPLDKLTAFDVGQLGIDFRSIRMGEASAAELFPDDTAETATGELRSQAAPTSKAEEPAAGLFPEPDMTEPTKKQLMSVRDGAGATIHQDTSPRTLLLRYREVKAKAPNKAEVARANLDLLRYLRTFASGATLTEVANELAAAEATGEPEGSPAP